MSNQDSIQDKIDTAILFRDGIKVIEHLKKSRSVLRGDIKILKLQNESLKKDNQNMKEALKSIQKEITSLL